MSYVEPSSLRARMQIAFAGNDTTLLDKFIDIIRDNLNAVENRYDKALVRLALLVVAFGLLCVAAISEIDLGFATVNDIRVVYAVLPVAIAYSYYECVAAIAQRRILKDCFSEAVALRSPALDKSHLDIVMQPPSIFLLQEIILITNHRAALRFALPVTLILSAAVLLLPPAFVVYSMCVVIQIFGHTNVIGWIAAGLSFLLVVQSAFVLSRVGPTIAGEPSVTKSSDPQETKEEQPRQTD